MKYYSPISRRIKALLIDGVFLALWLFLVIVLITSIRFENSKLEAIFILFIVASIEPILISLTGATVGQHLCKIKVQSSRNGKNISILFSYIRYLVKLPLGIFSLLTVNTTLHYQAIHDLLSRSIVVHKDSDKAPYNERLSPRMKPSDNYIYPSVLRRIVAIILYLLLSIVVLAMISIFGISESCINDSKCSKLDAAINFIVGTLFYINIFFFVALGWQAKLWGCRKYLKNV